MATEIEKKLADAVKNQCKKYQELLPKWEKTKTVSKGEDAVHEAGTLLLPKLESQTPEDYLGYVERARFFNAFGRTIEGLEGTVTRKPIDIQMDQLEEIRDNVTGSGVTVEEYLKKVLNKNLIYGFCGSFVDYPKNDGELTKQQVQEMNLRPKVNIYDCFSIINWRFGIVNNIKQLIMVVLKEEYEDRKNEFESETRNQYRVLRLTEEAPFVYSQQIYKETEKGMEIEDEIIPKMNNKSLDFIPFFFHGEPEEPPLYDLVTSNIKHYQLKADHNHVLHFVCCPTPYRTGVDPEDNNLPQTIGATVIWDLENENSKVGYLEIEGKGIEHVVSELETIKEDMAFLGAAMLMSDKMANETATKANFRNAAQTSTLASIVISLSVTATNVFRLFGEWQGVSNPEDIFVEFSTDFNIEKLTAQEILALVQSWQMGGISKRTLYWNLQEGERARPDIIFEDEEDLISKGE